MSSIASQNVGAGSERTNRRLVIGAGALAVLTGVLLFIALTSLDGNGSSTPAKSVPTGSSSVLVASESIAAGTKLKPEMFRVAKFNQADLVPEALTDPQAVVGQVTRVDILKGQQASRQQIGQVTDDKHADQLAFKLPDGMRGISISVNEAAAVTGLLVPGDRVDILLTMKEKQGTQDAVRVQTLLQNVLVVARAKEEVKSVVTLGSDGKPLPTDTSKPDLAQRPEKVESSTPSTVTLALSPGDAQRLLAANALGDLTLSLRKFGENTPEKLDDIVVPVFR